MKRQFSLRTLILVMTLGGPLLAGGVQLGSEVVRHLSNEEVHPGCQVMTVSWDEAIREAQNVEALGGGFQVVDKRRLELDQPLRDENSLHGPPAVD